MGIQIDRRLRFLRVDAEQGWRLVWAPMPPGQIKLYSPGRKTTRGP